MWQMVHIKAVSYTHLVTNYDYASKIIQNVKEYNYNRYNINGLIIVDKDAVGREISGIPVVACLLYTSNDDGIK